ncbi:MAG: type II secretion system protein [Chthoniobacterales bacterium]
MKFSLPNTKVSKRGFSLIELVIVVAILGLLATLAVPAMSRMQERAKSTSCAANLRAVGVAVQIFAQDNQNRLPTIEGYPSDPIYDGEMAEKAQTMMGALGPYGLTESTLECPADSVWFEKEGTSYFWKPTLDDELVSNPTIYGRRGQRSIPPQYASLCTDFEAVHGPKGHRRANRLYLDGHVNTYH